MNNVAYQDKITRSSHYQRIISLWEQYGADMKPKHFYETHVQPLDPSLDYHAFWYWQKKYEEQKRQRIIALTNQSLEQGIDSAVSRQQAQDQIRNYATQLFSHKVRDFVEHPENLEKMTFKEALRLYEVIRAEEDRQQMVELKARDTTIRLREHELMYWEWFRNIMDRSIYDHTLEAEGVEQMADDEWQRIRAQHGVSLPPVSSDGESAIESLPESSLN